MNHRDSSKRGFMYLEALAALGIVILVVGAFVAGIYGMSRGGHNLLARQQALLAAESVLNEIQAGESPNEEEFAGRFKNMKCRIERSPANGDFEGFDVVTVRVEAMLYGRAITNVTLRGIASPEETK